MKLTRKQTLTLTSVAVALLVLTVTVYHLIHEGYIFNSDYQICTDASECSEGYYCAPLNYFDMKSINESATSVSEVIRKGIEVNKDFVLINNNSYKFEYKLGKELTTPFLHPKERFTKTTSGTGTEFYAPQFLLIKKENDTKYYGVCIKNPNLFCRDPDQIIKGQFQSFHEWDCMF